MNVCDFFGNAGAWMTAGAQCGVVVSSRVRLARNLRARRFPGWANAAQRAALYDELAPTVGAAPAMAPGGVFKMDDLEELDRLILFERHLVSREQIQDKQSGGVVIRRDERLAVMVNEEDHLRLQSLQPGLQLAEAWRLADQLDSELEARLDYAFSPRLGYLTACPTNVGTGLRASAMLHLPGLVLLNEMEPVVRGLSKIGLAVRGLWGEGTEATGNMFQISNQVTLGQSEADLLQHLEKIIHEIVGHENNARLRLLEKKKIALHDHVGRAYGLLTHAHLLTSKEALNLLSGLRLGIELAILKNVRRETVDALTIMTQPAHLQKMKGKTLNTKQRDACRAELVRQHLAAAAGPSRRRDSSHE